MRVRIEVPSPPRSLVFENSIDVIQVAVREIDVIVTERRAQGRTPEGLFVLAPANVAYEPSVVEDDPLYPADSRAPEKLVDLGAQILLSNRGD